MSTVWDTSVASRLRPGGTVVDHVFEQFITGVPVLVAAPAIMEIAYGCERQAGSDQRFSTLLAWLEHLVDVEAIAVLPLDAISAVVAGRLRALLPHAPARRRGDARSKTMRQAAWLMDIQIAATAFAAGLDVATENRADFELLRDALVDLFPTAPPLAVVDGPV